jgi:hypothetical protein
MHPTLRSSLLAIAAVTMLTADDPSWETKAIAQWDDRDAKQVLAGSPWVKNVTPQRVRDLSVAERRDSGDWEAGTGHGVGLAGTGLLGPTRAAKAIARAHAHPDPGTVVVRWESALPVRAAETKAGETGIPAWEGDYYAIAVYNVPPPFRWNFANELKGVAFLKRDQKKDRKPSRVLILRREDGFATVVYLFSRSAEITKKDRNIQFVAQIGRLFLAQVFDAEEMQLQGKLEL